MVYALDEALFESAVEDPEMFCQPDEVRDIEPIVPERDDAADLFGTGSSSSDDGDKPDVLGEASVAPEAAGGEHAEDSRPDGEPRDPSTIEVARFPNHEVWEMRGDVRVRFLGTARYVGVSTNVKLECELHKDPVVCSCYTVLSTTYLLGQSDVGYQMCPQLVYCAYVLVFRFEKQFIIVVTNSGHCRAEVWRAAMWSHFRF